MCEAVEKYAQEVAEEEREKAEKRGEKEEKKRGISERRDTQNNKDYSKKVQKAIRWRPWQRLGKKAWIRCARYMKR